jgi:hypothetical protein
MRALLCCLALLVSTLAVAPSAFAQAEDRGYGGPATVGPNFSTGKQSAPPDYGSGAKTKPAYKKPSAAKKQAPTKSKSAAKPAKQKPASKTVQKPAKSKAVAKSSPAKDEPSTASTTTKSDEAPATTSESTSATTAAKPETCRRFDATTSTTVEVACN